jgi:hypothetical protein
MAILNGPFDFLGSMGNLVAYKQRSTGKTIIQRKGGPSKEQIKHSPRFERTRENIREFSACSKAATGLKQCLHLLAGITDFNLTSALTSRCKEVQRRDEQGARGERNVYLSQHRHLLNGFNLHSLVLFDGVVKHLSFGADRKSAAAVVTIPELVPGCNLALAWKAPYYRLVISLGIVADVVKGKHGYQPQGMERFSEALQYYDSGWQSAVLPFAGETVKLQLSTGKALQKAHTLVLAIGIEPGWPDAVAGVLPRKHAGAGKILAVF